MFIYLLCVFSIARQIKHYKYLFSYITMLYIHSSLRYTIYIGMGKFMEFRVLNYFLTVAQEENITKSSGSPAHNTIKCVKTAC